MTRDEAKERIFKHLTNWRDQVHTNYITCEHCGKTKMDSHDRDRLHFLYRIIEDIEDEDKRK